MPMAQDVAQKTNNPDAKVMADTLSAAVGKVLDGGKSPQRKAGKSYLTAYTA